MLRALLLLLLCFVCKGLPVRVVGLSFEHNLGLTITNSYVHAVRLQNSTCPDTPLDFVEAARSVKWMNVLKKEFLLEIPLKSTKQVHVEVEAIFDAKPYVFWERNYYTMTPLRIGVSSPANIEKGKPLWVISRVSLKNCAMYDVYTRIEIK